MLARYARLVAEGVDDVLRREPTAPYLSGLVDDYPRRGGKGIRSALVLAACRAYGGSVREALGPAVAIELMHNAFLVHDDVEDGSTLRRGAPTLHELHGAPLAVNAGDALAIVALRALGGWTVLGARVSRRISDELLAMLRQTTEGQALELGWRRDNVVDLGVRDYLALVAKKTSCYTAIAAADAGERAWLVSYLGSPESRRGTADVERVRDLMARRGSVVFAREVASGIELAATAALEVAFAEVPGSTHVAFVRGIVPYMLTRSS